MEMNSFTAVVKWKCLPLRFILFHSDSLCSIHNHRCSVSDPCIETIPDSVREAIITDFINKRQKKLHSPHTTPESVKSSMESPYSPTPSPVTSYIHPSSFKPPMYCIQHRNATFSTFPVRIQRLSGLAYAY